MTKFLPKSLQPVGQLDVNQAWTRVWQELDRMGFACRRLSTCQVRLSLAHTAYGYQWYGDRSNGRYCGDIVLPRISLSRWGDFFSRRPFTTPSDVLRHEYGHAYADVNRRRIETKRFEQVFGFPHEWWDDHEMEFDPDHHVTRYAATAPGEDFAEVFCLYLKHRGRLPRRLDKMPIRRKWAFVASLRKNNRVTFVSAI